MVHEKRHGVPFRIVTNGLFDPKMAAELKFGGVDRASVALVANNPHKYDEIMKPVNGKGHSDVCQFISALCDSGIETECTMVRVPGISVSDTKKLAEALGAVRFRVRDYFPL